MICERNDANDPPFRRAGGGGIANRSFTIYSSKSLLREVRARGGEAAAEWCGRAASCAAHTNCVIGGFHSTLGSATFIPCRVERAPFAFVGSYNGHSRLPKST